MATLSPACSVIVDGTDLSGLFERRDGYGKRLMSLSLSAQRGDEADQLELVFTDHDGRLAIPPDGAKISLGLGWAGQALRNMGQFKVDEAAWDSGPGKITVRARSADFTADMRIRRERSWRDTTVGEILGHVAAGAGLQLNIAPALASRPVKVIAQSRESDVAFMRRLGRDYDAVATIKAGALIFAPIGAGQTTSGKPIAEIQLTPRDGDRASWRRASRDKYDGVTAGYGGAGAARQTVTAGEKKGSRRLKGHFATQEEAQRAATAEWNRVQRGATEMSFSLALGRPDIHPECRVRFAGLKPQIDATTWLVKSVTHALGDGGFTTALQLENAP